MAIIIDEEARAKTMQEYFTPTELDIIRCALNVFANDLDFYASTPITSGITKKKAAYHEAKLNTLKLATTFQVNE